jgi:hypothetical protein
MSAERLLFAMGHDFFLPVFHDGNSGVGVVVCDAVDSAEVPYTSRRGRQQQEPPPQLHTNTFTNISGCFVACVRGLLNEHVGL